VRQPDAVPGPGPARPDRDVGGMTPQHGYTAYAHGCRCRTCRDAKAAYVRDAREQRRRARRLVQQYGTGRNYVDGITHGYAGYQDYSCRCATCSAAKYDAIRLQRGAHHG
jgi:hypothetical protein